MDPYVLWIVVSVGTNVAFSHQRYESREQCEAAFRDISNMPTIRKKMSLSERGIGVFQLDHVCSSGASRHQGAE